LNGDCEMVTFEAGPERLAVRQTGQLSFAGPGPGEVPRRGGACGAGRHYVPQSNIFWIDEGICRRFAHLEGNGQLFVESVCGEMDAAKRRHGLP
jgi:hypothetical protein